MNTDAATQPDLTERQARILSTIIQIYTNTPEPVGSKHLAEQHFAHLSSATLRNEMAHLETLGLLAAPHTSAGRIPTEAAYRYYVRQLLSAQARELPAEEKRAIAQKFELAASDLTTWLRLAVTTLARTTFSAAMATPPRAGSNRFKHLALIATHGHSVMMILVLTTGSVRQQLLSLAEAPSQEQLTAVANKLNALCVGQNDEQLRNTARQLEHELERAIADVAADALDSLDTLPETLLYRERLSDGLSEVITRFTEREGAQQTLRLIEEQGALEQIIEKTPAQAIGEVQVLIAGEGRSQAVDHLGLVFSRYGVQGGAVGTLVVVGPTRMHYGKAISAVGYISGLISNLMTDAYGE
jgi:heat-inducible transcriptional repressor